VYFNTGLGVERGAAKGREEEGEGGHNGNPSGFKKA